MVHSRIARRCPLEMLGSSRCSARALCHTGAAAPAQAVLLALLERVAAGGPPDGKEGQIDGREEGKRSAVVSHTLHRPAAKHSQG